MKDQKTQNPVHLLDSHDVTMAVLNAHPADRRVLNHYHGLMKEKDARTQTILRACLETLGQVRLDVKYVGFDLEATRRERDQYLSELKKAGLR